MGRRVGKPLGEGRGGVFLRVRDRRGSANRSSADDLVDVEGGTGSNGGGKTGGPKIPWGAFFPKAVSRSTSFAILCTAQISKFQQKFVKLFFKILLEFL